MLIKVGGVVFDSGEVTHVARGENTTTLTFIGGSTLEFTDNEATAVWDWWLSQVELELRP